MELLLLYWWLPLLFLFGIGLGGCCCCIIFSDDFNRSNSTNLGSNWTENTGNWSIASNRLSVTEANAKATSTLSHPSGAEPVYLSVTGTSSVADDEIYLHTNNGSVYIKFKFNVTAGLITLVTTTGSTTLEYDTTEGTDVDLTLCIVEDGGNYYAVGSVDGNELSKQTAYTSSLSGVGTVTCAGTATFDNFSLEKTLAEEDECNDCARVEYGCNCMDLPPPDQYIIDVTDNAPERCRKISGFGTCDNSICYDTSGSYYVDKEIGVCEWTGPTGLDSPLVCDDPDAFTTCGCVNSTGFAATHYTHLTFTINSLDPTLGTVSGGTASGPFVVQVTASDETCSVYTGTGPTSGSGDFVNRWTVTVTRV